jgi:VanZ family protein
MTIRKLSWLPAAIIMIIIFLFSAKPAVSSAESSRTIANAVLNIAENFMDPAQWQEDRDNVLDTVDHIVRKTAHFMEYAILASAIELHYWITKRKGIRFILLSILFSFLYAATDEFHQLFVPGRSGECKDVMIDTVGAATGAFLFYFLLILIEHIKRK